MKRRTLALLLVLALLLAPAALAMDLPVVNHDYVGYRDVRAGAYYSTPARICYETGLITGYDDGLFHPERPMPISQVAVLAARILAAFREEPAPAVPAGAEWYQPAIQYLADNGIEVPEDVRPNATRLQFFRILSAVVPEGELTPINSITSLPDTQDPVVLTFYNAGILTGMDNYGTFNPTGTIDRGMAATMIARILQPSLRQKFTPVTVSPTQIDEDMVVITVNQSPVYLYDFLDMMCEVIQYTDMALYRSTGARLDWNAQYEDVDDLPGYFIDQTVTTCTQQVMAQLKAQTMGCSLDRLMELTVPEPSRDTLVSYVRQGDYLAAKHILVSDYDTALAITGALDKIPTMDQFNALLTVYNTDPGMTTYPEGYLFLPGDMVYEFESAVEGLDVGAYSKEPVPSVYGYHIIWRLDPGQVVAASNSRQYTDLSANYRAEVFENQLNSWVKSASVSVNYAILRALDVPACYQAYLQALMGD